MIYTHDEAADIVDMFELLLDHFGIHVPSPEDDERGSDNEACLYGSVYSDLVYEVEEHLCGLLARCRRGERITEGAFSDER